MIVKNSFSGKYWKLADFDERKALMFAQKHQINPIISKLFVIRNILDEKINEYLNPDIKKQIPEPFIFIDMEKSVNRTYDSILKEEKIAIIADYDVDGSTSAAILIKFLNSIKIKTFLEIPDRINEGFGPNKRIIDNLKKNGINLIISLDCGTSSFDVFNKELLEKLDVIIIDHHVSELIFPEVYSIVNPNRYDEKSDFKNIASVGLTFIFLIALRRKLRENNYYVQNNLNEQNLMLYLDLVALGTVCDVVSLKELNRTFVYKGLEIIQKRMNKGITALIDISNIRHQPNTYDLAFSVGPKLNAASRVGDSRLSSKILYSNDQKEIDSLARKLHLLNEKRKLIEDQILNDAREQAISQGNKKSLVLVSKNWHPGIIGIVASKIVDEFNKPTVVIYKKENNGVGSARSVSEINLGSIIIAAKEKGILVKGGGHKMAAGLTITNDKIKEFSDFLENNIIQNNNIKKLTDIDSIISIEQINKEFINNLEIMEPFGNGNPEPVFMISDVRVSSFKIINEKHIILILKNNVGKSLKGIGFNMKNTLVGDSFIHSKNKKINIIGCIKKDNYNNRDNLILIIKDGFFIN